MAAPVKIVFDAYHLYHLPQFDPVIDLLAEDDRFAVTLTTSAENSIKERNLTRRILEKRKLPLVLAATDRERAGLIRDLDPDVFICGWSRYPLHDYVTDRTLVGMIYHGIGVKPSYWRDNHQRLDLRFVEGPFRARQLQEKGVATEVVVTGFAKLDPLFNGRIGSRESILRGLGLDPDRRTLLYAPTFYPSSFEKFGIRLGEYTRDCNVILKPHMWVQLFKKFTSVDLSGQRKLARQLSVRYAHIRVLDPDQYNIIPYLQAADALLTEASSTIYEMMALHKPVIRCRFYKLRLSHALFRQRLYRKRLDAEMSQEMTDFCLRLDKPGDLPGKLEEAFYGQDTQAETRSRYIDSMLYRLDGRAAQRIRDAILERVPRT